MRPHRPIARIAASLVASLVVAITVAYAGGSPIGSLAMPNLAWFASGFETGTDDNGLAWSDGGQSEIKELPEGVTVLKDIPYGPNAKHVLDVYLPTGGGKNAPVIFMAHGGAWFLGNKERGASMIPKAARWVSQGFVLIAPNYRLSPEVQPVEQAEDMARALASAQKMAATWGANPDQFILMGHSAGAHLVSLVTADPSLWRKAGAKPWLGTIALDSAAFDVTAIMAQPKRYFFFDKVFGTDPQLWAAASPTSVLQRPTVPFLAVCGTQRADRPCEQARAFIDKYRALGARAQISQVVMSHADINRTLGANNTYTQMVERFMASLHPNVQARLQTSTK